ncbi:MAG TPA: putative Ig domain-containing protein [Patescibacteria group bacterium]|nr:putative Ig domain-containing protein [Patescibacteria group bacterium]
MVPTYTNQIHLLDYNSSGTYTLSYAPTNAATVDSIAPISSVLALPASSKSSFTVQWSGTDNPGGSGVGAFRIFCSTNGGPFGIWISNTPLQAAVFTGVSNATYAFYSRATDLAGNQEAAHATTDTHTATTSPDNFPPSISAIGQQTVADGTMFTLTPSATDPDVPIQVLTWSLSPGAPAGALISHTSGLITWQTGPGDSGTTNRFSVVVTDNGTPSLSATQSFNVIVARLNHAPTIVAPPLQVSVDQQSTMTLPLSATDPDIPQQTLTWRLGPGAPAGLALDSSSGLLTWTPAIAQGPSTNLITVSVQDNGVPPLSDSKQLSIIVNAVNHAPVFTSVTPKTAYALLPFSAAVTATDPDVPAQSLTYSLDPGAPTGSRINPTNGLFTWTPTRAQSPSTNLIMVRVTDNGFPAMSSTQSLTVIVLGYVEAALGTITLQAGQTGAVALTVDITTPITNLSFTLDAGSAGLANFLFTQTSPVLQSATLQSQGTGKYLAQLIAPAGHWLQGPQTLAMLAFSSSAAAPSAFVPLRIESLTANQTNGVPVSRVLADDGRVVLVNGRPLLEPFVNGNQFQLRLFGQAAPSYTVQSTLSLVPPVTWATVWTGSVDNTLSNSIPLPLTNSGAFFRAKTP